MTNIINSIDIKNFRSYKDVHVDFHPGVNVVISRNDSGKSNILRAIDWVVENQPDGNDYFPLYWNGNPHVELNIGGKTVGRFRSKTENIYTLSGHDKPFKSFGRGKVPEVIKNHLNMYLLNFSFQFDPPFLLGAKPAEVARHYNSLVKLDVIDSTLKNINSIVKAEKRTLAKHKETVETKEKELKEFDWLFDAENDLVKIEKLNTYLNKIRTDWSDLHRFIEALDKLNKQKNEIEKIVRHEKKVLDLINLEHELFSLEKEYKQLSRFIDTLKDKNNEIEKIGKIIQHEKSVLSLIDLQKEIQKKSKVENELQSLTDKLIQCQKDKKRFGAIIKYDDTVKALLVLNDEIEQDILREDSLGELVDKLKSLSQKSNEIDIQIEKLEKEFTDIMPETCPIFDVPCDHLKGRRQK